ncbi:MULTISPECIES: hypothetical protein [Paenibacillus]|uniref:STAS/SEC14 domain-containing protein n=1 Tax=Paenibacillus borealis TaxID=160799 RepID=A0ABX3HQ71_PAEBO|nr:hypothetical protein [Paenibacillus borealis]OMD53026.1 hypothetical protein BSK56_02000 [Paenibacillus borealis]
MSLSIDESGWPLVSINLGSDFGRETVEEYILYWEKLLERKVPFGLLMQQQGERSERPPRDSAKLYMDWCKAHKDEISRLCVGIAIVMGNAMLLALYKPVTALSTKRMYGCPGGAFSSQEEAARWLEPLLMKKGEGSRK